MSLCTDYCFSSDAPAFVTGRLILLPIISTIHLLWSTCVPTVAMGTVLSAGTGNPSWLMASTLDCLPIITAQRNPPRNRRPQYVSRDRGTTIRNEQHMKRSQVVEQGSTPNIQVMAQKEFTRNELLSELASRIPSRLKRWFSEQSGWVDLIIRGVSFVFDVTGISTPAIELQETLDKLEKQYWLETVYPVYSEHIVPWTICQRGNDECQVSVMRATLIKYGWVPGSVTPLRFMEEFQQRRR